MSPCRSRSPKSSAATSSPSPARGEASRRQIAKDFGISEGCLHRWLKIADREDGINAGAKTSNADASAQLREARKRIKLLEQEAEVMRRAVAYLSRDVNPK